ncbi:MAG: aspartate-semialdehyde dehydrogenase [Verrucomicrobiota bacterium]|jgi:aspartate-semialdehyde dehydrogenase|nr:aspartate-semialdehyde dehydrogenase [Verrucomicrobiota bacterium]
MREDLHIAIVGATGAVGVEMIKTLERRNFPASQLVPLASARSAGKTLPFRGENVAVQELTRDSFAGVDIALFSAGGGTSAEFAPVAVEAGAVVVDNSSAFRMDDSVPLVVPEINAAAVGKNNGIIANPNCSTIVTVMALNPLHQAFGVKRIFASTYQAVSGSGAMGIVELERQVGEIAANQEATREVYPHQIAFNVLPHVDVFLDDGYTKEEMKMVHESRKIMDLPEFKASVTCVRVPVYRAHSIAVSAEFEKQVSVEEARKAIITAPGIDLNDDIASNGYPLPLDLTGKDNCQVGRIRKDCAFDNGLSFWVAGDQLLKGAALNTVQIAEEVAKL